MRSCLTCDCATRKRNEVVLVPPTDTIPVWSSPGRGCRPSHLRLSSFSRRGTSCSRVFGAEAKVYLVSGEQGKDVVLTDSQLLFGFLEKPIPAVRLELAQH